MISLEEYLRDPCGSLSVPLWKWRRMTVPGNLKILHQRDFVPMEGYRDECYFRLRHELQGISGQIPAGYAVRTAEAEEILRIVEIINASYPDIRVSPEQIRSLTRTPVYAPALWLLAVEESSGQAVGCVIADLDKEAREGILEWVQVLPEFRRKGIARALILEALDRMEADFATVSGQVDNETSPELLYRACGFTGSDIWHILRK